MNDLNTKWQGSNQQINKLYQYMNFKKLEAAEEANYSEKLCTLCWSKHKSNN